jgi:hypothetical protein
MSFIQPLGQLRAPVATYAQLPITGNVLGDLRILSDLGTLWVWMNSASSGSLSDWSKLTVGSYSDLQGRPSAPVLDIDNAVTEVRNIYLNYVYLFYLNIVSISPNIMKMFEGVLDAFVTEDGIDLTRSTGEKHILVPTMRNYAGYYKNDFDGSLDTYTRALIQGKQFNNTNGIHDFFDALLNDIYENACFYDTTITKFGFQSINFVKASGSYLLLTQVNVQDSPFHVDSQDFTWDFWARTNVAGAETIIVDHSFNHDDGINFKIEKLADNKIHALIRTCTTYDWDNQYVPHNPVTSEVTSTSTVPVNTWVHIAIQRQSGHLKLFINGNLEATSAVSDNQAIIDYLNPVNIGNEQGVKIGMGFDGWMEEIRFSKGVARYTSNFTPRTTPYNTPTQVAPSNNMVIVSNAYEANSVPTSARIVIFEQNPMLRFNPDVVDTITPNTDIKVYVSRDGGATFTQATDLKIEFDIMEEVIWTSIYSNVNFLIGTVDLSSQPSGKEMVYKITTHNNKDLFIRSVAVNWK